MLILKFITMPIFIILGIFWVTLITLYLTAIFICMWLLGLSIAVRENGEETGYIRWFKFIPKVEK